METRPLQVDVLAVGPHPDDIELGCGGALVLLRSLGHTFGIADLTDAEMGTRGTPELRRAESARSAETLGASFRANLGLPDGRLLHTKEAEDAVIDLIRAARPSLLFVPYPLDRHPDHTVAGRLVPDAAFRAGFVALKTGRPHHRPLRVLYYLSHWEFQPSFIVDVSAHWETKRAALHAYRSQFFVLDEKGEATSGQEETVVSSPEFMERFETRGRFYGSQIAARYGEPYFQHEAVRVDDPMSQLAGSVERLARRG